MNPLEFFQETRKLPPGHYLRGIAERGLELEYKEAHTISKRYASGLALPFIEKRAAWDICVAVTKALGVRPIRAIILRSSSTEPYSEGHYHLGTREIHLAKGEISADVLFHELAHHAHCELGLGRVTPDRGPEYCSALTGVWNLVRALRPEWFKK